MIQRKTYGATLAAAAAGLLLAGSLTTVHAADPAMDEAKVKCAGINSCKGKTACKSASNECKGKNSCKGKGWVGAATPEECTSKGGKPVEG